MTRLNFKKRNVTAIALCLAAVTMFCACETTDNESKSSEKEIIAFAFTSPAAEGTISGMNITATLPAGTNVTKLIPEIAVSPKATVSPKSGVATNFTNAVKYTVTAEDGSTAEYTVTVTVAAAVAQHDPKLILSDGEAWLGGDTGIGDEIIKGAYIFKADGTYDYYTYVVGYENDPAEPTHGTWETFDGGDLYNDELILNHNNFGNQKYTYTVSATTFTYKNAVTDLTTYAKGVLPWIK